MKECLRREREAEREGGEGERGESMAVKSQITPETYTKNILCN